MSESHQREAEIFDAAMELPPEQRAAYLDQACGGDAALRRRLEALLKAGESNCEFLASPTDPALCQPLPITVPPSEKPGNRIGPRDRLGAGRYKLLEQIGEGGCGVVYVAEQTDPVRRRVALKIVKLGMDTKSVIARFEAERQALALMEHPSIAKVFDAGATETGRPYFVMELVRGMKITDYCDEKKLSPRARLDLFIQVCHAIQHAHQKGIIHRDVKPSNILVTINDGVAVPKVIDFGVAKATGGQQLTDKTVYTAFEQFIGTPAYMSPEQAVLTSLDIDTRSDIYALGVLLYELLTGKTPFDPKELLAVGLDEMRRTIRETEPPRPSTCLSTLPDQELSTTAQRRGLEAPKLVSELQGDLDWIVMKCLEKDRVRRYETANGLAMDIERHLNNEPVVACPPSAAYRFGKMVRRNKLVFATTTGIVLALVLGLGTSTWMFIQERAALSRAVAAEQAQSRLRQEAQTEAAKSKQISQFHKDMLKGVGPSVALGRDTKLLQEILDQTAERVGRDLTNQPEVEIEMRLTLAEVYDELGLYKQEEQMAQEALRLARSISEGDTRLLADALAHVGWALRKLDNLKEAEHRCTEALEMYRRLSGDETDAAARVLSDLGIVLEKRNKLDEAETVYREALRIKRNLGGDESLGVAPTLNNLGVLLLRRNKSEEAEIMIRRALEINSKRHGKQGPLMATLLHNLASVLANSGNLAEAEKRVREALAMERQVLDDNHPQVEMTLMSLADVLMRQGKFHEAETELNEGISVAPDNVQMLRRRATCRVRQGHWREAEVDLAHCIKIAVAAGPPNRVEASHRHELAAVLIYTGQLDAYRALCRQSVERFSQTSDTEAAYHVAKDCAMRPDSGVDLEVVSHLADISAAEQKSSHRFVKALVEYRQGRFASAAEWAEITLKLETNRDLVTIETTATLALGRQQLQQNELARAALKQAQEDAEKILPKVDSPDWGSDWLNVIVSRALLSEAEQLIEGSSVITTNLLNDFVSAAPEDVRILQMRATHYARQCRWKEAEVDLTRCIQLDVASGPAGRVEASHRHELAAVLIHTGQLDAYRALCRQSVERFSQTSDTEAAYHVAKDCAMRPDSGVDLEVVGHLAEVSAAEEKSSHRFVKALAEYRQGRFASAAEWAEKTLKLKTSRDLVTIETTATLAMARQRLQQNEPAQAALKQAREDAEQKLPKLDSPDCGPDWLDLVVSRALLSEAEELIEGSSETRTETK